MRVRAKANKTRYFAQSRTKSLKYMAPLKVGTELQVLEVLENTITRTGKPDIENDHIMCKSNEGELIKIAVRDFATMALKDDSKAYDSEGDTDTLILPLSIMISSSKPRQFEGKDVYPLFAYEGAQEWLDGEERDFAKLLEGGLKEGNKYSPVQDYTIETVMN